MTPLQAAATNYRIAQGSRVGQKVLSLQLAPRHLARRSEFRPTGSVPFIHSLQTRNSVDGDLPSSINASGWDFKNSR